jgi:peptidoglycan/LPS O-acetylase OafA/YrhL
MKRSPIQRLSLLAAALFGVAPLGFGFVRAWRTEHDLRMVWMALVASLFAAGVIATAIGRRRTRHAVISQSAVIFVVATLLAGCTGFLLGATDGPGVWAVGAVLGLCLAAANVLFEFARPSHRCRMQPD